MWIWFWILHEWLETKVNFGEIEINENHFITIYHQNKAIKNQRDYEGLGDCPLKAAKSKSLVDG